MEDITITTELASVMAGLAVLAITFAVTRFTMHARMDARMGSFVRRYSAPAAVQITRVKAENQPAIVERMNRRLRQASFGRNLQERLVRAGLDMPASRFIVLQALGGSGAYLAVHVYLKTLPDLDALIILIAAPLAAVAAVWGSFMFLGIKESRRLKRFEGQLPICVDAMASALQAGSSLPQVMEMISREMPAPIGEEMAAVVREMAVGVPMPEAFNNFLKRVHSLDLDMLLTAISIQYRVGGNLSQILRSISHTIRERLRIKGEIQVLTAQQRMSAYIVSLLPVGLIAVLFMISPGYISKLFLPGVTRAMLVMGALGIVAGYYSMMKIADIDV